MMHIPLLSTIFGLGGAPSQDAGEGAAAGAFAGLLASVPAQPVLAVQTVPETGLAKLELASPPPTTLLSAPLPQAQATTLHAELSSALAGTDLHLLSAAPALPTEGKLVPAPGKSAPQTGTILPVLPLASDTAAPVGEAEPLIAPPKKQDEPKPEKPAADDQQSPAIPLAFADLALLQGRAAVEAKPISVPPPERQYAAAAATILPLAQPAARNEKDRPAPAASAPRAEPSLAPVAEISVPLVRLPHDRAPRPLDAIAPVQQPALQFAEPENPAQPAAATSPAEQPTAPAIELASVIDRLVLARSQSREGRSEVNVPHPDFGRVTLSLSLAEQDRLGLTMPDAPPELRAAVGQAFAPPPRTEPAAPTAESALSSFSDARTGEQRRDNGASQGRAEPRRPQSGRHDRSENPQFQHRPANGRGVLA